MVRLCAQRIVHCACTPMSLYARTRAYMSIISQSSTKSTQRTIKFKSTITFPHAYLVIHDGCSCLAGREEGESDKLNQSAVVCYVPPHHVACKTLVGDHLRDVERRARYRCVELGYSNPYIVSLSAVTYSHFSLSSIRQSCSLFIHTHTLTLTLETATKQRGDGEVAYRVCSIEGCVLQGFQNDGLQQTTNYVQLCVGNPFLLQYCFSIFGQEVHITVKNTEKSLPMMHSWCMERRWSR